MPSELDKVFKEAGISVPKLDDNTTPEPQNVEPAQKWVCVTLSDGSERIYVGENADQIREKYEALQIEKRARFELAPWENRPEEVELNESNSPVHGQPDFLAKIKKERKITASENRTYFWVH